MTIKDPATSLNNSVSLKENVAFIVLLLLKTNQPMSWQGFCLFQLLSISIDWDFFSFCLLDKYTIKTFTISDDSLLYLVKKPRKKARSDNVVVHAE